MCTVFVIVCIVVATPIVVGRLKNQLSNCHYINCHTRNFSAKHKCIIPCKFWRIHPSNRCKYHFNWSTFCIHGHGHTWTRSKNWIFNYLLLRSRFQSERGIESAREFIIMSLWMQLFPWRVTVHHVNFVWVLFSPSSSLFLSLPLFLSGKSIIIEWKWNELPTWWWCSFFPPELNN